MWVLFAFGSAILGLTAIPLKIGSKHVPTWRRPSDNSRAPFFLADGIFVGSQRTLADVSSWTLLFLILSGFAISASWLCYFKALQMGDVNKVTPIDKSSTVLTMILAIVLLGEEITLLKAVAMLLIGGRDLPHGAQEKRGNQRGNREGTQWDRQ